jgi:adenylate kinase
MARRCYGSPTTPNELHIALVGPPGCGKGTHASKLASTYQLTPLSTGDLLRDAITNNRLDEESKRIMSSGGLVPSSVVVNILRPTLQTLAVQKRGWVLDGFPRKVEQAEILQKLLQDLQQPLDMVLFINVDPGIIVERLSERRVHLPSGRVYNLSFKPPKVSGKDDVTGEELVQRDDDKPETIRARLAEYARQTQPILDFYQERGLLFKIDSPTSPEGWVRIQRLIETRYPTPAKL